jgi:uncharacterized membrane protein YbaN (DUF454 family)
MDGSQQTQAGTRLKRGAFVAAGTLFLCLGILGAFLPFLPATPLLLLSAACYARGSRSFYNWLIGNRLFGSYIRNYREGRGVRLWVKVATLLILWGTVAYSVFFVAGHLALRIVLLAVAFGVSIHIIRVKTLRE